MKFNFAFRTIASVLLLLGSSGIASATVLSYSLGDEVSGSGATLSGPVAVTLDDNDTPGTVTITIDLTGWDGTLSEYLAGLYLNFNPAKDVTALTLTTQAASDDDYIAMTLGQECCQPDGRGEMDIRIDFDISPPADRFVAGETYVGVFGGIGSLVATDFEFLNSTGECAIARVRSTGSDGSGSGWFACDGDGDEDVPEPASLALLGLGLLGVGARRRRHI